MNGKKVFYIRSFSQWIQSDLRCLVDGFDDIEFICDDFVGRYSADIMRVQNGIVMALAACFSSLVSIRIKGDKFPDAEDKGYLQFILEFKDEIPSDFSGIMETMKERVKVPVDVEEMDHGIDFALQLDLVVGEDMPVDFDAMVKDLGDREVAVQILTGYCDRVEKKLEHLNDAVYYKKISDVHREAHSIKGGSMNIHAPLLREAALELEIAAKKGRMEEFPKLLEKLRNRFTRVLEYVKQILKKQGE